MMVPYIRSYLVNTKSKSNKTFKLDYWVLF